MYVSLHQDHRPKLGEGDYVLILLVGHVNTSRKDLLLMRGLSILGPYVDAATGLFLGLQISDADYFQHFDIRA